VEWKRREMHTEFWQRNPKGKRPLGKSRNRRWNNVNMHLKTQGMIWPVLDLSGSDEKQRASFCDCRSEQQGSIKCGELLD
jgi:hypothetical protein